MELYVTGVTLCLWSNSTVTGVMLGAMIQHSLPSTTSSRQINVYCSAGTATVALTYYLCVEILQIIKGCICYTGL